MRLMDQVRGLLRAKHYAYRTEECYVYWILRYIRFHHIKHPNTMGSAEIEHFLTHLATTDKVAASTQNQALAALLFLYKDVLKIEVGELNAVRARRPVRVPTVMTRDEAARLLQALAELNTREPYAWMAQLMYGSGLRLMECCRLRVKDIDLARGQLTVREGKGDKDRFVMLPTAARSGLEKQLQWRQKLHEHDLKCGYGRVEMPTALARKFPGADHTLGWQFAFASTRMSHCPRTGAIGRHHVHEAAWHTIPIVWATSRAFHNREVISPGLLTATVAISARKMQHDGREREGGVSWVSTRKTQFMLGKEPFPRTQARWVSWVSRG